MRLIKLGLLSLFFLFLAVTAISLFIPSHIRISKAINIHSDAGTVLSLVRHRESWKLWHPAYMGGDSARKFPRVEATTLSDNDSEVVLELRQEGRRPVVSGWKTYAHEGVDSLTLQWYMDFHLKWYPWQKLGSLFYENAYGVMMQQGLENIRKAAEK